MPEVPARLTPWQRRELLAAYAEAWLEVMRVPASRACLAILWAQSTVECGHDGRPGCFNWNVSNIMAFEKAWSGDYHVLRGAPECGDPDNLPAGAYIPSTTNIVCPYDKIPYLPMNGSRFRAYPDLHTACVDKVRVLDRIWPRAIVALSHAKSPADVEAVVMGLIGPPRYFTAASLTYGNGLRLLCKTCLETTPEAHWPIGPSDLPSTLPAPPPEVAPVTRPQTPTSRSSQRIPAVDAPILEHPRDGRTQALFSHVEGEHTVEPEDPEL